MAAVLFQSQDWELPYAAPMALKKKKNTAAKSPPPLLPMNPHSFNEQSAGLHISSVTLIAGQAHGLRGSPLDWKLEGRPLSA